MYLNYKVEHNNNGDIMSKIDCSVKDCAFCIDGCRCSLEEIQIVKDIRNENSMYNTICQSYEEEQ